MNHYGPTLHCIGSNLSVYVLNPLLFSGIFGVMKNIYLDNAATTPVDARVLEAMMPYFKGKFGNASSVHSYGRTAKVLLEDARDLIADFIGAKPSELFFTSGGTEANNFAIKGIAFANSGGRKKIISTKIEHSAVLDSLDYISRKLGFEICFVDNNKFGEIDPEHLESIIDANSLLICAMHSNNELGIVNDIKHIAEIAAAKGACMHADSVQSIGKTAFNVNKIGCNTATLSAHKIYGPKGIGALYVRKDTPLDKFIHGGKQERDRRGGTENIPAIAGFMKAVELLKSEMELDIANYRKQRSKLIAGLNANFAGKVIINAPANDGKSLPNILNFSFAERKSFDSESVLIKLDLKGIAVSSGSACSSGSPQPSHVLKAIGYNDNMAKSSIRISFGRFNTEEDIDVLLAALKEILA